MTTQRDHRFFHWDGESHWDAAARHARAQRIVYLERRNPARPFRKGAFMSAGSGGKYAADLWDIYEVARTDMMDLADRYEEMAGDVAATQSISINPPPYGGGAGARNMGGSGNRAGGALLCGAAMSQLRDELQTMLKRSGENVATAAATLMTVARTYAEADEETKNDFDSRMDEAFGNDTAERPWPDVPAPEKNDS